jgi:hypothetical protein
MIGEHGMRRIDVDDVAGLGYSSVQTLKKVCQLISRRPFS